MADPHDRRRGRHRQRLAPVRPDAPLRLLPARHVPLSAEQEQTAVDALGGLLASLIARDTPAPVLEVHPGGEVGCPSGPGDGPADSEGAV
jgi:hypothetical protein